MAPASEPGLCAYRRGEREGGIADPAYLLGEIGSCGTSLVKPVRHGETAHFNRLDPSRPALRSRYPPALHFAAYQAGGSPAPPPAQVINPRLVAGGSLQRKGVGPRPKPADTHFVRMAMVRQQRACASYFCNRPLSPSVLPPQHRRAPANWMASDVVPPINT